MNKLLTGLVSLLALCQVSVLNAQSPKLFVMISVEELRSDLLEELSKQMPDDGLVKLLSLGRQYSNVQHPLLSADATASQAILHTGTTALTNGIVARQPLTKLSDGRRINAISALEDKDYTGFATSDKLSPTNLSAPTISDQLKQNSAGKSWVYSVAPSAEESIIAAGQLGDGAFWVDNYSGKWASTTYYKEGFPRFIEQLNTNNEGVVYKLQRVASWKPLYSRDFEEKYSRILPNGNSLPFSYNFTLNHQDILQYKQSSLINEDILEVSKRLLAYSPLGDDEVTDFLALTFTVGGGGNATSDIAPEVIDSYYRLDRAVAQLLKAIDKNVGLSHTLIALSGNGIATTHTPIIRQQRIFKPSRCKALINMYLNAKYGKQGFIDEITPQGEVFLNHKLIEETREISIEEIQTTVSNFLIDFSGVQYAIEEYRLRQESIGNQQNKIWATALNKSTHDNRADVVFELLPGWIAEDLSQTGGLQTFKQSAVQTTLVLLHPEIKPEKIDTPIDLREISKKVSWILRIRPPTP